MSASRDRTPLRQPIIAALLLSCSGVAGFGQSASNWPQFRGPNGAGTVAEANPPIRISPSNHVLWRIEVPWSPSSPCVWGQKIFITTFDAGRLETRCYAAQNGRVLWSEGITPEKLEVFHRTEGSPASATPASDGRRVVSYFGSFGVVCYDFKGKELWRHPLPVAQSGGSFGSGTSPSICRNCVIINRDQDEKSSLLALDLASGKTVWETPRPEAGGSFGTPILWDNQGVAEVVMPGSVRLKGYELKTGHERWMLEGVAAFACPSPVAGEGMLFYAAWSPGKSDSPWPTWEKFLERYDKNHDGMITFDEVGEAERDYLRGMDRDHDGKITEADWKIVEAQTAKAENVLVAVKPGGQGDISKSHIAWKEAKGLPYVASPVVYDGRVYFIKDGGMLSSLDARTGKSYYSQERLEAPGSYYASPVSAAGRIYLASLSGKVTVVQAGGDSPRILHQADFGDRIFATPALAGTRLYLRTQTNLYAFGEEKLPGRSTTLKTPVQ